jgi:hypothetical protein
MIEVVLVALNRGLLWQKLHLTRRWLILLAKWLEMRRKLVKRYISTIALYDAETWTLRAVDQKHQESVEMLCWRRMEKISWADRVRNEDVLESRSRGISYMK